MVDYCRMGLILSISIETRDLHIVTLLQELIQSPPIELWPKVSRRITVPLDVENILLTRLERDQEADNVRHLGRTGHGVEGPPSRNLTQSRHFCLATCWFAGQYRDGIELARKAISESPSSSPPIGSMKVSDDSVLYEFCVVPRHIPLELLAMTPPIVQQAPCAGAMSSKIPGLFACHRRPTTS
jgi:hypothetical protein